VTTSTFEYELRRRAEVAGLSLPIDFAIRAERYYELLQHWNKTTNLTALPLNGYPAKSLDRLLIEPLHAAELLPDNLPFHCLDVGSGGGSPAIPVAIARPLVKMSMVESVAKKSAFLREAVRLVALQGAEVVTARAEELVSSHHDTFDLILIRAVSVNHKLSNALEEMLKPGGKLFVFGGSPEFGGSVWRLNQRRQLSQDNELQVFEAGS